MARTINTGLSYYPFDCRFFSDIKVRRLIKYQGGKAVLVYIDLLCRIYDGYGYYMLWDDDIPFIVSEDLGSGYDEAYTLEVIKVCVTVGLFDKDLFDQGVLTSSAIQVRYKKVCDNAKRKATIDKYCLLDIPINSELIPINSEEMQQRKENRSKVNNTPPISKEIVPPQDNVAIAPKPSMKDRAHKFGEQLIPYIDKYGKEMIRNFYDYWTAHDEGDKKMAFEKAKSRSKSGVFDIPRRLATWKRIEDEKKHPQPKYKKGSTIIEALEAVGSQVIQPEVLDITKLIGDSNGQETD